MKSVLFFTFILNLFLNSTTLAQKKSSPYSIVEIDSILKSYEGSTDYDKVLSIAQIGAEKVAQEVGKQDTLYAKMLFFIGFAYHQKNEFDQAESHYRAFLEIQRNKNPKHLQYALGLNNLGLLCLQTGRYPEAELIFKDLLALRKEISGEKSAAYASNLNNLANLYYTIGRYREAESSHKQVMAIRKNLFGENNALYASSANNLAGLYDEMGRYAEAEPLYKKSLAIRKEVLGEKHPEYATSLNNLGVIYWNMGNYVEAEALFREALAIRKEVLGEQSLDYVASLYNMAVMYQGKKEYDHAEILFRQTLALHKEIYGPKHPEYASDLNNLAILYQEMGRSAQSIAFLKEALSIQKTTLGAEHPDYALSLNNLAAAYKNMEQYEAMEPLCKEVLENRKASLGTRHPKYLTSLNNLAELHFFLKNNMASWDYIQQAIASNSQHQVSKNITKAWADSLSKAEYASVDKMVQTLSILVNILPQQQQKAIVAGLALELLDRIRNSFLNESDKLRTLEESAVWTLQGLKVLDKKTQIDKAFLFAEQNKSVLLLDAIQAEQAYSLGNLPDSLMQKESLLQQEYSELEAYLLEEKPLHEKDSLRSRFNSLSFEIKDFKKEIEKKYPQYATLKYGQKDITISEVQALLNDQSALLEYVIGDSVLYIFYIDKQTVLLHECFVPNKVLNDNIQKLHQALSDYKLIVKNPADAYRKYIETAYWFYENLLYPVLPKHQKIKDLIIVTDGALGHLPFEAFLVKPAPQVQTDYSKLHYLVNDYNISYNYSATCWRDYKNSPAKHHNGQLFAMSALYTNHPDTSHTPFRLPAYQRLRALLRPLSEAKKEVEVLSKTFQGFYALDSLATERVFKEKAGDFGIIHLAMHGLLDQNNSTLSSLAFTEDGDTVENNFLQAYEISKMKLNADLVVLSACETGYGRFEHGNGIASLARAFMYAGVPSLVVSLWQVNDHSTAEVMKGFYNHLSVGMPKDAALRQAKLDYLEKTQGIAAHPAFWSAFVQLGDNCPITVEKRRAFSVLWAIMGGILLLGVGIFAFKRKREKE